MLQKINANKLNGAWHHKIGGNDPLLSRRNCTGIKSVMTVKTINNQSWPIQSDLLILDEIHKKPQWKKYMSIFSAMQPRLQKSAFTWNNTGNP